MILTGSQIKKEIDAGTIGIKPFEESRLNPNSYNLCLHNVLYMVKEGILDMREATPYEEIVIPESGYLLEPGHLYLGRTVEYTETYNHVPLLEGRSSVARLGISIHATAGFGDLGFCGFWTLEISVIQPVVIYPFIEICQIYYTVPYGDLGDYVYKGKYQCNTNIQTSQLFKELNPSDE